MEGSIAQIVHMHPSSFFRFCPRCGAPAAPPGLGTPFGCAQCRFQYYFNPAIAAAAFITRADGAVLFVVRAKDPAKGKLALPGGFIDAGETVEAAVRREAREEVGVEMGALRFITSEPNQYHYREVTYPVLDFFFAADLAPGSVASCLEEVTEIAWLQPSRVCVDEIAFPSVRRAFEFWRKSRDAGV